MSVKNIVSKLSTPEKIELYNCLYTDLAGKGIDGDTELAHVNVEEMQVLRDMGGSGTVNPHTGLIQFGGGSGGGSPAPAPSQSTIQKETIPDELKPFVTDVLEKSKALQERREEEGYVPFEGPRIARFTPEQEQAFAGVQTLQGASQPYFRTAEALTASSALAPNAISVGQFMNPYIQNVIDIQTREANRAADVERQRLAKRGVDAGAFGGSRQAILEAEANRSLQQRLGDIQARGLAAAFEDAQNRLAQQRNRERSAGSQFASLGTTVPGQTLRELTALETVGATRRDQGQQSLDIAQQEYEVARTFPERTLQDYQSIIRGYSAPIPASTVTRTTGTQATPSALQQVGGLGLAALGTAGAFGAFKKEGGLVGLANGGKIGKYSNGRSIGGPGTLMKPGIFGNAQQYQVPNIPITNPGQQFLDQTRAAKNLQLQRMEEAFRERERLRQQQNPLLVPTQTQESKDYLSALKGIDFAKRKADVEEAYTKEVGDIERDKYLALAKAGLGILSADPAGKTPLQTIASGFLESKALADLKDSYKDERKLLRERRKDLQGIEDKKLANMAGVANLTQAQAKAVREAEVAKINNQIKTTEDKLSLSGAFGKATDSIADLSIKIGKIQADKEESSAKAAATKADRRLKSATQRRNFSLKQAERIASRLPFIQRFEGADGSITTRINKENLLTYSGKDKTVAEKVEKNIGLVQSLMGDIAAAKDSSEALRFGRAMFSSANNLGNEEKIRKAFNKIVGSRGKKVDFRDLIKKKGP